MENWVKLRSECSAFQMFMRLRKGTEEDVKVRNEQLGESSKIIFKVVPDNGTFGVCREIKGLLPSPTRRPLPVLGISDWIDFSWDQSGIHVKDKDGKSLADSTLTLTDELECKLKLKTGEELSEWQFRKRVLEDLFFDLTLSPDKLFDNDLPTP